MEDLLKTNFFKAEEYKKSAFTLAEVLITLGIIGVVAALTMPSLIRNHKKQEIETRLKQNYSIIQNASLMAQAEYGDPIHWEGLSNDSISMDYFNNYIFKYIKTIKAGSLTLKELGYKTPVYLQDGKTEFDNMPLNQKSTKKVMSNGSIVIYFGGTSKNNNSGNKVYSHYQMVIDLNGAKGPNTIGKDIFIYIMPMIAGKSISLGLEKWTFDPNTRQYTFLGSYTHQELVSDCSNTSKTATACGALIQESGWKIPNDYPLKF